MFINRDVNDGVWFCSSASCDYRSKHLGHLKQHIESKHVSVSYPCPLCHSICPTKNALSKHYSRNHKDVV